MNFLRRSPFDLHTDGLNPTFQSVIRIRVHLETLKNFRDNLPPNFTKKIHLLKEKVHLFIFTSFFLKFENCLYNWLAAKLWSFETILLITSKPNPDRNLINPQDCFISTDSAHVDLDSTPSTVTQPYPDLSKVSEHLLKDKDLKLYNNLGWQHYPWKEILLLTAQSDAFLSKKQNRHNANTNYQIASYAQITSSAKIHGKKFRNWKCQWSIKWLCEKVRSHQTNWRNVWTIPR